MKFIPNKWVCSRCKGTDSYWTKRRIGQVGGLFDNSNSAVNSAFTQGIGGSVALCHDCGERINLVKDITVAKTMEDRQKGNLEIKLFLWIGIPLFIILLYISITIDLSSVEGL